MSDVFTVYDSAHLHGKERSQGIYVKIHLTPVSNETFETMSQKRRNMYLHASAKYTAVYKSVYACEDGIPGSALIPTAEYGRLWLSNTFKAFEIQALATMPMTAQVTCGSWL
jgi:hypothetical protein